MWITNCQAGSLVFFSMEYEILLNYFTNFTGNRDIAGDKRWFSHVYFKFRCPAVQTFHMNRAWHSFNVKFFLSNISIVHQIFGKNTHAVSTDGRFTSVCVKNTHTQFPINFYRSIEHTVSAKPKSSLAEKCNLLSLKLYLIFLRIKNQIIVSKSLIFTHNNCICHNHISPSDL